MTHGIRRQRRSSGWYMAAAVSLTLRNSIRLALNLALIRLNSMAVPLSTTNTKVSYCTGAQFILEYGAPFIMTHGTFSRSTMVRVTHMAMVSGARVSWTA